MKNSRSLFFTVVLFITCFTTSVIAQGPYFPALRFDGNDDYVLLGNGLGLVNGQASLTISAWIRPDEVYNSGWNQRTILGERWPGDNYQFAIMNNFLYFSRWLNDGSEEWVIGTPGGITALTWQHVAVTYDGIDAKLYINGNLDITQPMTGIINNNVDAPLNIGAYANGSGETFLGIIDEVRIWNIARTQNEIQADMNQTLIGNEPGLVGYWPLDGDASDLSINANHGTVFGAQFVDSDVQNATIVTFHVNTSYVDLSAGDLMGLRGSFPPLDWGTSLPLTDLDGDGVYEGTATFDASYSWNTLEYKFVVDRNDGSTFWEDRPGASGPYYNRILSLDQDVIDLPIVNFNYIEAIADVRVDANGDNVPDRLGQIVTVSGVILTPNLGNPWGHLISYIQDGSNAAIQIYSPNSNQQFNIGDAVTVTGELAHYYGSDEIIIDANIPADFIVESNGNPLPTPIPVTFAELNDPVFCEAHESQLISIDGVSNESGIWPQYDQAATMDFSDSFNNWGQVSIVRGSNIDGSTEPEYPLDMTGILTQRCDVVPYDCNYHIMPRSLSDLGIFVDQALNFDGIGDDNVVIPHGGTLAITGPVTLEAWVNVTQYGSFVYFIDNNACHSMMLGGDGNFLFHWYDGNWQVVDVGSNVVPLNRWTHLAIVRDVDNIAKFYVNGLLMAERSVTTPLKEGWDTEIIIGRSGDPNEPLQNRYVGDVDEVSIWNIARTQAEIQNDMSNALFGDESGLAGYWRFDGDASDLSPNEFDAIVNGAQFVDSNVPVITWEPVTFQVDMSVQIEAGNFVVGTDQLVLRGSFNGWTGNSEVLLDGGNQIYSTTLSLASNQIGDNFEYKFVITENGWETIANRSFVLQSGGQVLDIVFFDDMTEYVAPIPQSAFINGPSLGSRIRVLNGGPINQSANPSAYQITGTNITVEAWVYPLDFPDPQLGTHIAGLPLWPNADPWQVYGLWVYHGDGFPMPAFTISTGEPGSETVAVSPDTLKTFQWNHLAGTYNGQFLNLYVNGELKSQVATNIEIGGESVGFYIGRFLYNRFFGLIDDVRLWNIARSQTEIQNNLNVELTGNETGLVGYWKLDEGVDVNGTWATVDETPNHNDLIVQGSATTFVPFHPFTEYGTPSISDYPASIDFGTVEQTGSATQSLTISNLSLDPLIGVGSIAESGFRVERSGFFVPPETTEEVSMTINTLDVGNLSGTLILQSNAASSVSIPFTLGSIALQNLDVNNIEMWVQRDGRFARNPFSGASGFEWPRGSGKTAIYASGIWAAATVGGETRTAAASWNSEFAAGPILNGAPVDPNDTRYRVYKIQTGDDAVSNPDFADWPVDLGAPANSDGTPKIIGDQTLFTVYNDLDASRHHFGTSPLGIEVQQTTFGFDSTGSLGDAVFLRFKVINRSNDVWENTYVALWSDPDLGGWTDDLVGVDVSRSLGYCYNGGADDIYGSAPPAVGYDILKGAFYSNPIQAFSYYATPGAYPFRDPRNGIEAYNFMQGFGADGTPYIDPTTSEATTFPLSGDPVSSVGWVDSNPNDRRFLFSTGPFNLEPGQSKELIAAIIVGQGADRLSSITALRSASDTIQTLFDDGYIFGGAVENIVSVVIDGNSSAVVDDIENSGAQLDITAGTEGVTVEVASYIDPPPGAEDIADTSIGGVGNYLDIQVQGDVIWPVDIRIYYTANDLAQAGALENELQGLYYWSGTNSEWRLYSNSGADDQGRGPSTSGINPENVIIGSINYEGYISATAYHLTPIIIGYTGGTEPFEEFAINEARIDFNSNSEQDKVHVKGGISVSSPLDTSQSVTVIVGPFSQTFKMDEKKDKWEYKRPHGENNDEDEGDDDDGDDDDEDEGDDDGDDNSQVNGIKKMKIDWKKGKFDIKIDHVDLNGITNPVVFSVQIGNTRGIEYVTMEEQDHYWDFHRQDDLSKTIAGGEEPVLIPEEYALKQNYPNPFNAMTTIRYDLPEQAHVTLIIYDVLGREVKTIVNYVDEPGYKSVIWNATNDFGLPVAAGLYLYQIRSKSYVKTSKMILLK